MPIECLAVFATESHVFDATSNASTRIESHVFKRAYNAQRARQEADALRRSLDDAADLKRRVRARAPSLQYPDPSVPRVHQRMPRPALHGSQGLLCSFKQPGGLLA
eukprot:6189677-Pleurochrysis_carterae.AAC.1